MTNAFSKSALCVAPMLVAMLAVTASGQGLIEDFNTDGDGSRYNLEGRFLVAADNGWSTVPATADDNVTEIAAADVLFTYWEGEGFLFGANTDDAPAAPNIQFNPIDTTSLSTLRIA